MAASPLNIVGAGLGGLTLARCLRKRGIPTIIYEKSPPAPRHSYGITLHRATYAPLLRYLDLDEPAFRQRVAVDTARGGTGVINEKALTHGEHIKAGSFRANGWKLESLLREGLDIRYEHALDQLVAEAESGVELHISNGQKVRSSQVIAAEGPHSRSRMSMLPGISLEVLPFVAFNGKRKIDRAKYDKIYKTSFEDGEQATSVVEMEAKGAVLNVQINDYRDEEVSISWVYSRSARGKDDVLYKPNRPNAGATDIPDEFFKEIRDLGQLPQPFKDVFDADTLKTERILSWLMRALSVGLEDLTAAAHKGVYFLGDAVHAQPILGGQGANAAIEDGISLAERISTKGIESVSDWFAGRHEHWKQGVERSKTAIEEMHRGWRPSL